MKRLLLTAVSIVCFAAPAAADVTLKQSLVVKAAGRTNEAVSTTFIKGHKMRTDTTQGDKTLSIIFDVDAGKVYVLDSKKKEADVWDMTVMASQIAAGSDASSMKATLTPSGQTKAIIGATATGYQIELSMPTVAPGGKKLDRTVTLSGPLWVVKGAPGSADYGRFFQAAADKGFIFTNPEAAKFQPGQAKATAEMYRRMSALGGIPYESTLELKLGGASALNFAEKMGNTTITTTVTAIETTALADSLFTVPGDYKLTPKK